MSGLDAIAASMPNPSSLQGTQGMQPGTGAPGADPAHEQAFLDAVQRSAPVQQIDAQPALASNGFMSNMTQRLDSIASHLQVDPSNRTDRMENNILFSGDPAVAPATGHAAQPPQDLGELTQKALDNYRSTMVFSVEAQVATNGSSTSTKTFNNLLKGS
ncbi:hypothetical protein [Rhizosaccharibacter radicis]|uniref:Uncharacterized protein n=1 Tax=Rhizosaccharibacter radicis TaxID=2782605 RepID=A0ABT1VTF8_9PROT|nr:hypothetical protein [Acetobacteraceae bacterium KSS12]